MEEFRISSPAALNVTMLLMTITPITTRHRISYQTTIPSRLRRLNNAAVAQNSSVRTSIPERNSDSSFNEEKQCVHQPRRNRLHQALTWDSALALQHHCTVAQAHEAEEMVQRALEVM
jgi:hypothetical protein